MLDEEAGISAIYEAVLAQDINGDGRQDLVALTNESVLDVYLQSKDGAMPAPATYSYGTFTYSSDMYITPGDFNGDDLLDVAFSSVDDYGRHGIDLLLSRRGMLPTQRHAYWEYPASGYGIVDMVSMDADGDGNIDLVLARNNVTQPSFQVLSGNGQGQFTVKQQVALDLPDSRDFIRELATHDIDGDGLADLEFSIDRSPTYEDPEPRGRVLVAYRTADGLAPAVEIHDAPKGTHHLFYADVNGDARDDAVIGYEIHLRNQDGSFGSAQVLQSYYIMPSTPALADFDGDGLVDLVNRQFADFFTIPFTAVYLQRNGTLVGTLQITDPPFRNGFNVGYHRHAYATADVNSDGCRDFVAAASYDGIVIMEGENCIQKHPRLSRPLPPLRL